MSTTSRCPACCTWTSCARRWPMRASRRSTRKPRWPCPACIAVLTADDLKPLKLHWMPTLAGDVQAVLADGRCTSRCRKSPSSSPTTATSPPTAVEAVEVEYEELPVVVDPFEALKPGAPVLREDLAGKTEGAHGKREHHNHIFTWDAGDKAAADAAFAKAEVTVSQQMLLPARAPLPAGDLRLRGFVRPGARRADHLHHLPGAARGAHRGVAAVRHPRIQGPHRRRPTSAAASATRSASIPAMSAPSSPPSCWAGR